MKKGPKKKNWFRRHWIISIFLGLIGLWMMGSSFEDDGLIITESIVNVNASSNITENVVNEQVKQIQSSRDNPLSTNTSVELVMEYGWWQKAKVELTVTDVKRGGSAWSMIKEANMFNDEPMQGKEYLLTKVRIKVIEVEDDESYTVHSSDFKMVSSKGVVYENPYIVEPEPELGGEAYSGGVIEGWIAFEVDKLDLAPLLRIEKADGKTLWIRIDTPSDNFQSETSKSSMSDKVNTKEETGQQFDEDNSTEDWLEEFEKAMEDIGEALENVGEQQNIYEKIDECTELGAGENIDIPYIKSEFYSACLQIYYYAGEEALDNYIEELKGEENGN